MLQTGDGGSVPALRLRELPGGLSATVRYFKKKVKVCAAVGKGICYEVEGNYCRIRARRRRRHFANFIR